MNCSCLGLSKTCFLVSLTICTFLLLFIPQLQTPWRPRTFPQPRRPPAFNSTCDKDYTLRGTENAQERHPMHTPDIARFEGHGNVEDWQDYKADNAVPDKLLVRTTENISTHRALSNTPISPVKEDLELKDIFLAVKTTHKYHRSRLDLLLQTWISRAKKQTYIFTDGEDEDLRERAGTQLINTNCSAVHTRQALCCKMAVEYDKFIESEQNNFMGFGSINHIMMITEAKFHVFFTFRRWFCHVDDDNYVNLFSLQRLLAAYSHSHDVYLGRPSLDHPIEAIERVKSDGSTPVSFWFATGGAGFCISRGLALKMSPWASLGNFISTAEMVRLPDDCTIGYIIEGLLNVKLLHTPLFHSHLENLPKIPVQTLLKQVTLSYGGPENKRNVVSIGSVFSLIQDPTRFKSVHCLLYPDTPWCPPVKKTI